MRTISAVCVAVAMAFVSSSAFAGKSSSVRGYVKKHGTYVAPHHKTTPDGTKLNNYSTKGNVNPYTGKGGTVDPFKPAPSNPFGSRSNSRSN